MPGVIIDGKVEQVPGLTVSNSKDNKDLRLIKGQDCRSRYTRWVRAICLHTTKGIPGGKNKTPQVLKPGYGPKTGAELKTAKFWATSATQAGAHFVIDFDGSIGCCADLLTEATFHAGEVNEVSIGIEIYQGSKAELYEGQLDATVRLVDFLTRRFRIQRQLHWPYRNKPVPRIAAGVQNVMGIYGHREVTTNRGLGYPGNLIFEKFMKEGYEKYDFAVDEDLRTWLQRQEELNMKLAAGITPDGVSGPKTVAALVNAGYKHGLWVLRFGDTAPPAPERLSVI